MRSGSLPTLEPASHVADAHLDFTGCAHGPALCREDHPLLQGGPSSAAPGQVQPHPCPQSPCIGDLPSRGAQGFLLSNFPGLFCPSPVTPCPGPPPPLVPATLSWGLERPGEGRKFRSEPTLGAELRLLLQGVPSVASERCYSGRACPCTPVRATCSPPCCPTTPTWPTAWRFEP